MDIPFIKMHAQGNDFVIIDNALSALDLPGLAKDICLPHFGLGADGLVILDNQDKRMTIYNADGSRAEMCGSALRCCCSLLAVQTGMIEFKIITDNGSMHCNTESNDPFMVRAQTGSAIMLQSPLTVKGLTGDYISVGNPHFVIFCEDISGNPHLIYGQDIASDRFFPDGVNVEFVKYRSSNEIDMLVWERGVGSTLACGTGATAAVFSGQLKGLLDEKVLVTLPGGEITIELVNGVYFLTGKTHYVADGVYKWKI